MLKRHFRTLNRFVPQGWRSIGVVMLLATALYLFRLDARGLWIDEFLSIRDAQDVSFNRGRLLYYVLLEIWMTVGQSDVWLRSLAVLFALCAVALTYQLGRSLFTKRVGLIAALMLALSPLFINHAQEVRYYTMSVSLGIAGSLALAKSLNAPNRPINYVLWVIFRVLAVLTTPLNAALLVSDGIIILVKYYRHPRRLVHFAIAGLILSIMTLPVALSVLDSAGAHRLDLPVPGLNNLVRELRILTAFSYPPPPPYLTRLGHVYILTSLLVLGVVILRKRQSKTFQWLVAWTVIPVGMIFIFSHLIFSIWNTRYVMLVLPYLLIMMAVGFLEIRSRWHRLAWAILLIYAITVGSGLGVYYTRSSRYMGASDHYRATVEILNQNNRPDDVIVWAIMHNTPIPIQHYYEGTAPVTLRRRIQIPSDNSTVGRENIEAWLSGLPSFSSRLWLVYGPRVVHDDELFYDVLTEEFMIEAHYTVEDFNIFLLTSTEPRT
ncbi:glycosyltransferase family 39 protein [Sodalinema gerasimenkoae]|uniref:glycosyltransferase family 39 protein n=1 Tax=Sodalinema gerasimenkoae TaxID=2862348 RepID=UPI001356C0FF|nr:glycosyltransferase family 39 protein [Sodalinema gerasimenkoae]